jgi:hypothetical protein
VSKHALYTRWHNTGVDDVVTLWSISSSEEEEEEDDDEDDDSLLEGPSSWDRRRAPPFLVGVVVVVPRADRVRVPGSVEKWRRERRGEPGVSSEAQHESRADEGSMVAREAQQPLHPEMEVEVEALQRKTPTSSSARTEKSCDSVTCRVIGVMWCVEDLGGKTRGSNAATAAAASGAIWLLRVWVAWCGGCGGKEERKTETALGVADPHLRTLEGGGARLFPLAGQIRIYLTKGDGKNSK